MAVSPDWRESYPAAPEPPAELDPGATDEARAARAAALATYNRSMRVWFVARQISGRTFFPTVEVPETEAPAYRTLSTADVAVTLADDYAPGAPVGLRQEAAIRAAGWLRDVDPAAAQRTVDEGGDGGSDAVTFRPATGGALRASGGMGILTRYRIRRAGAVEPAA